MALDKCKGAGDGRVTDVTDEQKKLIERSEEIKTALRCDKWPNGCTEGCPYLDEMWDECNKPVATAAAIIEALEAELERVKRERDAAVEDISGTDIPCNACAHYDRATACEDLERTCLRCNEDCPCAKCDGKNFEWIGREEVEGYECG